MKIYRFLTLLIISIIPPLPLNAAEANNCNNIEITDWLLGEWQSKNEKNIITETWKKADDKNLNGIGTTTSVTKDKAPFIETLRILEMSGDIFFMAKTPQNKLPVAFKLVSCSPKHLKFENKQHDFPQIIEYQMVSSGQILAKVSAENSKGFQIEFKREKVPGDQVDDNANIITDYIEAYNNQNLSEMMKFTGTDIHWMSVNGSNVSIETSGREELSKAMQAYFSGSGNTQSSLNGIISNGNFVSAIEKATWFNKGKKLAQCSPVVYQLEKALIKNVWYFPAEKCNL